MNQKEGKMEACKLLAGCPFFNDKMPIESGMGRLYKQNYCEGDFNKCARFKVATTAGREKVPVDLYPNMFDRAENIIKENKQ